MKKIIYVMPEYFNEIEYDDLIEMQKNGELLNFAKNSNYCLIYDDFESFACDFNNDLVSDLGYIFIAN